MHWRGRLGTELGQNHCPSCRPVVKPRSARGKPCPSRARGPGCCSVAPGGISYMYVLEEGTHLHGQECPASWDRVLRPAELPFPRELGRSRAPPRC